MTNKIARGLGRISGRASRAAATARQQMATGYAEGLATPEPSAPPTAEEIARADQKAAEDAKAARRVALATGGCLLVLAVIVGGFVAVTSEQNRKWERQVCVDLNRGSRPLDDPPPFYPNPQQFTPDSDGYVLYPCGRWGHVFN